MTAPRRRRPSVGSHWPWRRCSAATSPAARDRLGPDSLEAVEAQPPSELAARALLAALEGSTAVAAVADRVVATGRSTYLDRMFADLAVALAAARRATLRWPWPG